MKNTPNRTLLTGLSPDERQILEHEGIAAEECSAIFGLDPSKSAFTLWAEKAGKLPQAQESESARFDRENRSYVAKRFSEATGKLVRRVNALLRNPLYPYAYAELQYIVLGEDAGLTCQCVSHLTLSTFRGKQYPKAFYYPCLHRMMVTGRKKWYLAVLVLQKELRIFEFTANPPELLCLAQGELMFWRRVTEDRPPLPDASRSTRRTLDRLYPNSQDRSVDLSPISLHLYDYLSWQDRLHTAQKELMQREVMIKSYMGNAQRGRAGNIQVSWMADQKNTLGGKRIFQVSRKEDTPETREEPAERMWHP